MKGCYDWAALAARRAGHTLALLCAAAASTKYCVQFWAQQYKKDIMLLESVHTRSAKVVKDLEGKTWREGLR